MTESNSHEDYKDLLRYCICRGCYLEDNGMCNLSSRIREAFSPTQSSVFLIIGLFESG